MLFHPSFLLLLLESYGWCVMCQPRHKYPTQEPFTLSHTQQQTSMPDQSSVTIFTQFHSSKRLSCLASSANCTLYVCSCRRADSCGCVPSSLTLQSMMRCTPNGRSNRQRYNNQLCNKCTRLQ
jgi:hypothetical protein